MRVRIQLQCLSVIFCLVLAAGSLASAEVIDKIVAIVNSDIITLVDVKTEASPYLVQIDNSGHSKEQKEQMKNEVYEKVLGLLIDRTLTQQEAKRYGISVDDNEVDAAVDNFLKSKSITMETLEAMLEKEGMTMDAYRETFKKQILQSKLINHAVQSKVVITDSEISDYYEAHADAYAGVQKYHLRNILEKDEEKIKEVYRQLKLKKGFADLAAQFSIAPNAQDGGDLGMFDISSFSEEIKARISKLKKGQFTGVMETAQGFQIFYVEDIVVDGAKTKEQAQDEIHDLLYREQAQKKFESWLESLKKEAHIEKKL